MAASDYIKAISITGIVGSTPIITKISLFDISGGSKYEVMSWDIVDNNPNMSISKLSIGMGGRDYAFEWYDAEGNVIHIYSTRDM